MNIEKIKSQFPILKQKNRGKKLIYLDNAATSLYRLLKQKVISIKITMVVCIEAYMN